MSTEQLERQQLKQEVIRDLMALQRMVSAVCSKLQRLNPIANKTVEYVELQKMHSQFLNIGSEISKWPL